MYAACIAKILGLSKIWIPGSCRMLCPDLDPILESPNTVLKLAMSPLACYCSYSCVSFIGQDIELLLLIMKYKVYIKAIIAYWPHRTSPLPPQL